MRQIKSTEEQALMQIAADFTREGVRRTALKIAPGVHTYELYAEFEYYLRRSGLTTSAFESVITTGKDCLVIHCEYFSEIKDGDTVIVDVGAEYEYYASDICRVYPANGKFTPQQRYYYEAVIEAEETIINALKPGFDMNEIGPMGDEILIKKCRDAGILKKDGEIREYLSHGIYHFLGLDSHDVGEKCILQPGMVLSIEPGLYISQLGIGVRVEDNILITEDGNINLTAGIPKTPDEIETEMR
jgi:Xaa-Pro aminopeptidase